MGKKKKKYPKLSQKKKIKVKKVSKKELACLLERARSNSLTEDDCKQIKNMADTIEYIITLLDQKDVHLKRVLKQILGIKTEKAKSLFKGGENLKNKEEQKEKSTQKKKGHGRVGASSYTGAKHKFIKHETLNSGDSCIKCPNGKVYPLKEPGIFIHIEAQPPIQANVYELEKLRCNLCGEIYKAKLPLKVEEVNGESKYYDETAKSMMAILRYGYGFPLNRLSNLQSNLGIPLPAATIWDKTEEMARKIRPVFESLKQYGAQGNIMFSDDTGVKILSSIKEIKQESKEGKKNRTGINTSGIVCKFDDDKDVALFFSGREHAGENLRDLLKKRDLGRDPPITMSDAKSVNKIKDIEVIDCSCNVHARRKFVEVSENFPQECEYVIVEVFKEIYKNDNVTREMNKHDRLEYHKKHSAPIMDEFKKWLMAAFAEKKVEPNGSLGKAISYMLNHWDSLTKFLEVPGVPLDNNICERSLKMSIRHRKNSLFYKTLNGAYIGDMFMSLIQTCILNNINTFEYLNKLQIHSSEVHKNPSQWLPWNYMNELSKTS